MKALKTVLALIFFVSFVHCDQGSVDRNKNEFQVFIGDLDEKQSEKSSFIENAGADVYGFHKLLVDRNGQVIVVDDSNWSVHLFSGEGELISSAGGKGEGPGEFMLINDLSLSFENHLYLLDKRLHRISSFSVTPDKMEYSGTYSLPDYSPLTLVSFNDTESQGYIGVFRELRREAGKKTPFLAYRLNRDFEMEEKLFEMPGNETILLRNIAAVDSPFGFRTFWHVTDDHFFYSHSDDLSFTIIDLQTLETDTIHLDDDIPIHSMTRDLHEFLTEHFRTMVRAYPEAEETIREKKLLPYFRNFFVDDQYILFDIFPENHDQAYVLGFDRQSTDLFTVRVPQWFTVSGIVDKKVIGIVGAGSLGENDILTIEF